jgi:hypothetical protein
MKVDKNNAGFLFKNDRKEKDTHKDYTGKCQIDGKHYWIAAWIHKRETGDNYLSLDFTPMEEQSL